MSQESAGQRDTGSSEGDRRDRRTGATSRRTFLGAAASVVAGGVATSAFANLADAAEIPYVTTRGHFEIDDRFWSEDEVSLTGGHSKYDYDVTGSIPGLDGGSTDEICLWIHGWRNDLDDATTNFANGQSVLRENGYEKPVVGYTYDADTSFTNWWPAYEIAEHNGYKVAAFVDDYLNDGGRVRIVCHSLGGKVTMSTLRVLAERGRTDAVESVTMLGAAVHDDECSRAGRYGPGAATAARQVDNFWMDGDDTLQWAFGAAEGEGAVGEEGVEVEPPANWEDHQVEVPGHSSYSDPDEGCMDQAVEEF